MNAKSYVPSPGRDVLRRDRVDMALDVTTSARCASSLCSSSSASSTRWTLSSGNFASTGSELLDAHDRVDALAARESMLQVVRVRRQDVGEKVGEQELAETTACFRGPERLLEPLQVVCPLEHALGALLDAGQLLGDLRGRLARALLGRRADGRRALEPPVDPRVQLPEPSVEPRLDLTERAVELGERATELAAYGSTDEKTPDRQRGDREERERMR